MIAECVERIRSVARKAQSESKLEVEVTPIIRDLLAIYEVAYDPHINETLKSVGRSEVSALRPDSLFGHVVMDYKLPGKLSNVTELGKSKKQIEDYLTVISSESDLVQDKEDKLAGVLFDGASLTFCRSVSGNWNWTPVYPVSESSIMSLIQIYRSLGREPLNSTLLCKYFGKDSDVAIKVVPSLLKSLLQPSHRTYMLYKEWLRLFEQSASYDYSQVPGLNSPEFKINDKKPDASLVLFALHTYYSVVVKLLTAELLNCTRNIERNSIVLDIANANTFQDVFSIYKELEDGDFYKRYQINNFLEGDFFSWYIHEQSEDVADSLVLIAHTFSRFEPATPKLRPELMKDLLKEFYSGIMDEQIRHDIGEYYTPDWLAQYVLKKVGYEGQIGKICVDPTCGSGTFLVECINLLRKKCVKEGLTQIQTLKEILNSIRGLDLNPLAVISARANYILAVADLIFELGEEIEIPVYLSDAINLPLEKEEGILEYPLETEVGVVKLKIPTVFVKEQVLGKILLRCEVDIEQKKPANEFLLGLKNMAGVKHLLSPEITPYIEDFYSKILALNLRTPPWDSIWCRVVKNNFSPKGFSRVDFIVGNPPWVRWSRLPISYRNRVKEFCNYYGLVSGRGYSGGIESDISTVIAFSAVDNWLKIDGKIGILITWTVFKSNSARGFRLCTLPDGSRINIDLIEDLTDIQPFPDATNATGIYIGTKINKDKFFVSENYDCNIWKAINSSRINPNLSLEQVLNGVQIIQGSASPVSELGSPLFTGEKSEFEKLKVLGGESPYLKRAHRGTVTDLARVYWVKILKYSHETNKAFICNLDEIDLKRAKTINETNGTWVDASLLYPLIRGRDVGRYSSSTEGWYQIIPNNHYSEIENENIFESDYYATYRYFLNNKSLLQKRSTYKRYLKKAPFYSIYCIGDYSFSTYKVVWPEMQTPENFRAAVIGENESSVIPNRTTVPDHKLYFVGTENQDEAHYLSAILNSKPARAWLGGFLLSKQIGASIFEFINIPLYDEENEKHNRLAEISYNAHLERVSEKKNDFLNSALEIELANLVYDVFSE